MSAQMLNRALPIFASALVAGEKNIEVTVGGNQSYTDYNKVNIAWNDPFDQDYSKKALGYTVHETGHILFSEKDAKKAILNDPIAMSFYGALEDVRMEKKVITERPGRKKYLLELVEVLVNDPKKGFKDISTTDPEHVTLGKYVMYRLRHDLLSQYSLREMADNVERKCHDIFPKGFMIRLDASIFQITKAQSTTDVVNICKDIADMLREEAEKEDDPETKENDSSTHESDDSGDGTDNSNSQSNSDSDSDQNNDSDENSDSDKDDNSNTNEPNSQSDIDNEDGSKDKPVLRQALKDAVAGEWNEVENDIGEMIENIMDDEAHDFQEKNGGFAGMPIAQSVMDGLGDHKTIVMNASAASNALSTQLRNLIETSVLDEEVNVTKGDLNTEQLHRYVLGDLDIFTEEVETQEISTAIHILLDRSGSMEYEIQLASQTVLAIALALEKIQNVEVATTAFPGTYDSNVIPMTTNKERVSQTATRYSIGVDGTTPLAEAMWYGLKELSAAQSERKMLLVVTDGGPNNGPEVHRIIDMINKNGIEVMAVGINSHAVEHYFKHHTVISHINELAQSVFVMLKPLLMYQNE